MRVKGVHKADALPGFVASWTADLPFVNVTLFEQAGVPLPQPGYTIDDLMKASKSWSRKKPVYISPSPSTAAVSASPARPTLTAHATIKTG
nr:hypothetical protein PJ912_08095 [Pectobacterium colocasium]